MQQYMENAYFPANRAASDLVADEVEAAVGVLV
jgi:hypothetical protein